jgi:hypothetical protein
MQQVELATAQHPIKPLLWRDILLGLGSANKGPVKIQYKFLVAIYVFPEMKLRSLDISRTEL